MVKECRMSMTISEPVAKALRIYTVQATGSAKHQSKVIEQILSEWLASKGVQIEATG
ncbi:MAG: hypothetical protein PHS80_02690 [Methanothrix sp.]|nr:hypothetical protein [Methanothrix sp.]